MMADMPIANELAESEAEWKNVKIPDEYLETLE